MCKKEKKKGNETAVHGAYNFHAGNRWLSNDIIMSNLLVDDRLDNGSVVAQQKMEIRLLHDCRGRTVGICRRPPFVIIMEINNKSMHRRFFLSYFFDGLRKVQDINLFANSLTSCRKKSWSDVR